MTGSKPKILSPQPQSCQQNKKGIFGLYNNPNRVKIGSVAIQESKRWIEQADYKFGELLTGKAVAKKVRAMGVDLAFFKKIIGLYIFNYRTDFGLNLASFSFKNFIIIA